MSLKPYVPGHSGADHNAKLIYLCSNENPLGASPRAREAIIEFAGRLASYPDGGATALREAIARKFGLDTNCIAVGNGSDELLEMLAAAYIGDGDEGLYTQYGFLVYPIAITAAGGVAVCAPEKDLRVDVDAVLARVSEKTKLVYITNPGNPTGSYIPFEEVKRLHAGLPAHVLLVLDAAYAEYVNRNDYAAGIELVASAENVVMTRTFSKVYGLAGLRVGWMFGPREVVDVINRIRGPFNVNAGAQAAAVAALADDAFVARSVEVNTAGLAYLTAELEALGLTVSPSVTNFILIHFPDQDGLRAAEAERYLRSHGLLLRGVAAYGLPGALRLTIGTEDANRKVVDVLKQFLSGHRTS
jgi:histidinol-phosphate aminotransferase